MRSCGCNEIVRELSAPTGVISSDQLAEHLRDCPTCASWAGQVRAFDELWRKTSIPNPPAEAWDRAWSQIVQQAGQPSRTILPFVARRRQHGRIAAIVSGLAAAAALIVTVGGSLIPAGHGDNNGNLMANENKSVSPIKPVSWDLGELDLGEGEVGIISLKKMDDRPEVEARELDDEYSGQLGTDMALLSYFEGISE